MQKTWVYLISALLVAFNVSAWAASSEDKDQLVIGITQYPSNFHPSIDSMMAKTYILAMTRRPFTAFNDKWKLICLLCTKLPTFENGMAIKETSPEGKPGVAVTYSIHPQATWGDGVAVSTKDVMLTWEMGSHPKSGFGNREFYRSLYKVDVIDDKTFTLHFDKLTFDYNGINDFELIPAHIDADNFLNPEIYKNQTAFDRDTTNPGLYFGPYRITKAVTGSHVVLEKNPTWWGKEPAFKRIIIKVIENTAALEANLLSGNIDMVAGELGLTLDQAIALEKRQKDKYQFLYKAGLIYEHIDLNLDNPILADKRVRQALVYAIDREAINDQLFSGRQPVAHTSVNPLDWVYSNDTPHYPFDKKRAIELLEKSGWSVIKKGIRHNAQGDKLTLEIMTTAGSRTRELVEQILQNQWKSVGVDIKIRNQPARVFFGQTVRQREFSAMAMFAWISSPENVPRTTLHSDHIPTLENNYAGQNSTGFKNAEMDALLEVIETELDRDNRAKLWTRIQQIYAEELPAIPLYFRANAYVLPKWLGGLVPTGHQGPSTLWVENWHRKE